MSKRALLLAVVLAMLGSPLAEARRKPSHGALRLRSLTEGATIIVDGTEVGATPLPKPVRLRPGKHTLKIVKRGYTEFLDVFTIEAGSYTDLEVDLLPYAGILAVSANVDGARVFVDNKFIGMTPLEKEILIGEHTVRISAPGYYDSSSKVKAVAGTVFPLKATLVALPLGSTPYRPKPLPPPKWYEKWYVWAGAAGGLAAATLAVVLPVTLSRGNAIDDFSPEKRLTVHHP